MDTLPISKQQTGAAWGGRMGSFGHIVGYAIGAIDLPGTFGPRLGDTQFKQLTLIASMSMLFTAGVTCWAVTERVLVSVRQDPTRASEGRFKVIRQIWSTLIDLPPRIQIICWAMFWAWIGWFPFHFYGSTWVGETYFRYDAASNAAAEGSTLAPSDALGDMGRIGSYTLTIYSFMTFAGAWLLPMVVRAPEDEKFTHRPPASIAHLVEGFSKLKPDLLTVWQAGHLMFASAMFLAPFAKSFRFATALVVFCGIRKKSLPIPLLSPRPACISWFASRSTTHDHNCSMEHRILGANCNHGNGSQQAQHRRHEYLVPPPLQPRRRSALDDPPRARAPRGRQRRQHGEHGGAVGYLLRNLEQ